ncbi:MAG: 50S ribosomal protein L4 [Minwuia thermotolerans]|nr:MAG: 50S ribosomal protein L4 [Minwuia thermotolerans]
MKLSVKTLDNKSAGEIELNADVFGLEPRADLLHRMVNYQLAKRRAGTHKTKGIGEIRGTTAKPFRQKGTGRARAGSLRASQYRGGATTFGPVVRSHAVELPKKVRRLALKHALSAKAATGELMIVDAVDVKSHKTKDLARMLDKLGLTSALFIDGDEVTQKFDLAARNLPMVDILPEAGANVYDILRRDMLVLTRAAVAKLEERLK